jgi:hypothetical protein
MIADTSRGTGFDSELSIQGVDAATWQLLAPLVWTGTKGDTFVVPIGFRTDFATIPRFLLWFADKTGPYTRAAVLHDYLIEARINAVTDRVSSRDVDGIFRRVMQDLGVPWVTRWTMWSAVRVAACFNGRRAYGRQFWRDAPAVFGVCLLMVPVVLPGVAGVLLSLGAVRMLTGRSTDAASPMAGGA